MDQTPYICSLQKSQQVFCDEAWSKLLPFKKLKWEMKGCKLSAKDFWPWLAARGKTRKKERSVGEADAIWMRWRREAGDEGRGRIPEWWDASLKPRRQEIQSTFLMSPPSLLYWFSNRGIKTPMYAKMTPGGGGTVTRPIKCVYLGERAVWVQGYFWHHWPTQT